MEVVCKIRLINCTYLYKFLASPELNSITRQSHRRLCSHKMTTLPVTTHTHHMCSLTFMVRVWWLNRLLCSVAYEHRKRDSLSGLDWYFWVIILLILLPRTGINGRRCNTRSTGTISWKGIHRLQTSTLWGTSSWMRIRSRVCSTWISRDLVGTSWWCQRGSGRRSCRSIFRRVRWSLISLVVRAKLWSNVKLRCRSLSILVSYWIRLSSKWSMMEKRYKT